MSNTVKQQAFEVFDLLTERQQSLVFEIIQNFILDDIATPEDIAAHEQAMEEYKRGECVRHEDINWG